MFGGYFEPKIGYRSVASFGHQIWDVWVVSNLLKGISKSVARILWVLCISCLFENYEREKMVFGINIDIGEGYNYVNAGSSGEKGP